MSKNASGICCIIKTCRASKRKVPNLRLFKFPKNNNDLLKQWAKACGIDESLLLGSRRLHICNRHFSKDQMGEYYLKKDVIPEKYLDTPPPPELKCNLPIKKKYSLNSSECSKHDELSSDIERSDIEPNDLETSMTKKVAEDDSNNLKKHYKKSGRRCIVKSCRATYRNSPNTRFFSFPSETERFQHWVGICKLTPSDLSLKTILICEKHFWKAEITGKRYSAEAEPRFFLSEPRYKVIEPSDPKYKVIETPKPKSEPEKPKSETEKLKLNLEKQKPLKKKILKSCLVKSCNITNSNSNLKLLTFPKEAINLVDVWSDIFNLNPAEVFNIDIENVKSSTNLFICEKHSLSEVHSNGDSSDKPVFGSNEIKKEQPDVESDFEFVNLVNPFNDCKSDKKNVNLQVKGSKKTADEISILEERYKQEIEKIKKESEKEKIKHLSIIGQLKEENFKLKEDLSRYKSNKT